MKGKKITAIVLGLVLTAICAVGAVTTFASDANAPVDEPTVAVQEPVETQEPVATQEPVVTQEPEATQEPVVTQEPSAGTKDKSAKKDKSGKGSMTFVGIDAVAAEVLGVSEATLQGLNHADELYAELTEAGKVDAFKTALIAAKQAQYDAKAGLGKFSAEALEEKLAGYTQVINDWDGTTELIVSSSKSKVK